MTQGKQGFLKLDPQKYQTISEKINIFNYVKLNNSVHQKI